LLSVQAHPPGNTEVYVIVEAEPGATIRLGFAAGVDAGPWAEQLASGRRDQQRLLELFGEDFAAELQSALQPWLARRAASAKDLESELRPRLRDGSHWPEVEARLASVRACFWAVLDSLNTVPVKPGDIIYNANPPRVTVATGKPVSAEVHALGNTEGRGVFALEIRRPGTTFRAWDNVRFPLRDIDIAAALDALNLTATVPSDFIVEPHDVRPGVRRSVDCEYFRLEHLEPARGLAIDVPATPPHSLHALAGRVSVTRSDGRSLGTLERGESALVPGQVGAYRLVADGERAELIKVDLPPYVD
jgi:mannose-6-phosphate isomerase class I